MGLRRGVALLLLAGLLASGCTTDPPPLQPEATPEEQPEPTVPSGLRAAVVLPPGDPDTDPQLRELRSEVEALARALPDEFDELRAVSTDGREFVPDVTALLARQGTDLVCVIGPDGRRSVRRAAELHPELRFCAAPSGGEGPTEQTHLVEVRFAELGHLLGVAAVAAADDGPIGAVIEADRIGRSDLVAGLEAVVGDARLHVREPASADQVEGAVSELLEAGVEALVFDVGLQAADMLALVDGRARLLVPARLALENPTTEIPVATWRVRWGSILQPVIGRMVDADVVVPTSVGFSDDALQLSVGADASLEVRREVEEALDQLRRGVRDPLRPLVEADGP